SVPCSGSVPGTAAGGRVGDGDRAWGSRMRGAWMAMLCPYADAAHTISTFLAGIGVLIEGDGRRCASPGLPSDVAPRASCAHSGGSEPWPAPVDPSRARPPAGGWSSGSVPGTAAGGRVGDGD